MDVVRKVLFYIAVITAFAVSEQQLMAIVFIKDVMQLWDLSVYNYTRRPLSVVDEVFYPNDTKYKAVIVNPGQRYRSQWITGPWIPVQVPALGRRVTIFGKCRGAVDETNKIIIGNTVDATFPTIPSGTYMVIGDECTIRLSNPINIKESMDPYAPV